MVANGHGVSSRPVSTSLRPIIDCRKKGRETIASICAQKEQMEVQIEREKSGIRSRSTGSRGDGHRELAANEEEPHHQHSGDLRQHQLSGLPWAKPLRAVISSPKVRAFIMALGRSKRMILLRALLGGRKRMARTKATMPRGTLIKNSHCHEGEGRGSLRR